MASPALAGEGWYLGLGAGWDHLENPKLVGDAVDGRVDARDSAIYAGTFGYKFRGLPFRLEAEAAWDRHSTGTFEDFGVDYGSRGHAEVRSAMLNGIFDYHLLPRLKLSIGGGAGVGQSRIKFSDPLGTGDYSSHSGTHFMWQGIGGLAYEIAPNWDLFVDYHYRNLRNGSSDNIAAPLSTHDLTEHVVLAGFRWYADGGQRVAEAPPEPPPPPPSPAPPAPVKNFIIFFDFNKSNLTADAESIVSDAVKAAQAGNMVKVLITGHTDTVGSHSYNQGLSERRAEAVKDEMVRQGMNGGQISTVGKSYDDPLVPTGPGVREPQNRRAVIQLGDNAGM